MKKQIILMDRARLQRTLKRMAMQVWELVEDEQHIIIIGLNERGTSTANLLAQYLSPLLEQQINVHRFNVDEHASKNNLPDCNGKFLLLVDDVLFSGRTMFTALTAICARYEPASVEIAALLDRGHRKYPLRTDIYGLKVPTKLGEHIEVMLNNGELHQAILFKNK